MSNLELENCQKLLQVNIPKAHDMAIDWVQQHILFHLRVLNIVNDISDTEKIENLLGIDVVSYLFVNWDINLSTASRKSEQLPIELSKQERFDTILEPLANIVDTYSKILTGLVKADFAYECEYQGESWFLGCDEDSSGYTFPHDIADIVICVDNIDPENITSLSEIIVHEASHKFADTQDKSPEAKLTYAENYDNEPFDGNDLSLWKEYAGGTNGVTDKIFGADGDIDIPNYTPVDANLSELAGTEVNIPMPSDPIDASFMDFQFGEKNYNDVDNAEVQHLETDITYVDGGPGADGGNPILNYTPVDANLSEPPGTEVNSPIPSDLIDATYLESQMLEGKENSQGNVDDSGRSDSGIYNPSLSDLIDATYSESQVLQEKDNGESNSQSNDSVGGQAGNKTNDSTIDSTIDNSTNELIEDAFSDSDVNSDNGMSVDHSTIDSNTSSVSESDSGGDDVPF